MRNGRELGDRHTRSGDSRHRRRGRCRRGRALDSHDAVLGRGHHRYGHDSARARTDDERGQDWRKLGQGAAGSTTATTATTAITAWRSISGAERTKPEGRQYVTGSERLWGHFTRELVLGDHLDTESIQASYVDGVLRLDIAVAESAKPRRIQVAVNRGGKDPKELTS